MKVRALSNEELKSIKEYAKKNGRNWKSRLLDDWMYSRQPGVLQSLRNNYGPSWLRGFKINPAPRIGTAKPKRKSQATGKAPTKRLVARRTKNTVKGRFPNPAPLKRKLKDLYYLSIQDGDTWFRFWAPRKTLATAKKDAEDYAKRFGRPVKIEKA